MFIVMRVSCVHCNEGGLCFDRVQTSSVYTHHWCTYVFRVQMTLGLSVILQQKQVMLCSVVVCSS